MFRWRGVSRNLPLSISSSSHGPQGRENSPTNSPSAATTNAPKSKEEEEVKKASRKLDQPSVETRPPNSSMPSLPPAFILHPLRMELELTMFLDSSSPRPRRRKSHPPTSARRARPRTNIFIDFSLDESFGFLPLCFWRSSAGVSNLTW